MVTELQYTTISRVLDNLLEHPLLRDVSVEQAVRYTIRFISQFGFPKFYEDKIADIEIHQYRGAMPCDLISIIQVKDKHTGICLRSMTDNFPQGLVTTPTSPPPPIDQLNNVRDEQMRKMHGEYIPERHVCFEEPSFKTQGRIIYTSFPEGCIEVSYKSIPVDDDGFPMLIDNEMYLNALELYIKKKVFTIKYDTGKISTGVLENVQKDYAVAARLLQSEFTTPSVSEWESITRMWTTMLQSPRQFDRAFKHLGNREYLRKQ